MTEVLKKKNFTLNISVENLEPVLADVSTLDAIIYFLKEGLFGLFMENQEEKDIVVSGQSDDEWVTVRMQHFHYQGMNRWAEKDSNLLICDEMDFYSPFCVARTLVHKLGGEV